MLILMTWWKNEMLGDVWARPFGIARYLGGVVDVPSVMSWHELDDASAATNTAAGHATPRAGRDG